MRDARYGDVNGMLAAAYGRTGAAPTCRKIYEDLDRYAWIVDVTKPDVVIETGTDSGASALWFAQRGVDVVTVDVTHANLASAAHEHERITCVLGESVDPGVADRVRELVVDRRVMVALDSDHGAENVYAELVTYAGLVTPGCYLVVEDGFLRWGANHDVGNPLDAIERFFPDDRFERDLELEARFGVTLNPAGWWRRR